MKITIYTITDCQFSKQEKDYLSQHSLPFEEKNLETNKEYLTEMLAVSNNFAGTPVTKIEKDDGQIVVLKGFTKDEFDQALGLGQPAATPAMPPVATPAPAVVTPVVPVTNAVVSAPPAAIPPAPAMDDHVSPVADPVVSSMPDPSTLSASLPPVMPAAPEPVMPEMPHVEQVATPVAPVMPPLASPAESSASAAQDEALKSILDSLKTKVDSETQPANSAAPTVPQVPDPNFKNN